MKFVKNKGWVFWLDKISAIFILIALFNLNTNPLFWLVYAVACLCFVIINFVKNLQGQAVMNFIAVIIAIFNFIRG